MGKAGLKKPQTTTPPHPSLLLALWPQIHRKRKATKASILNPRCRGLAGNPCDRAGADAGSWCSGWRNTVVARPLQKQQEKWELGVARLRPVPQAQPLGGQRRAGPTRGSCRCWELIGCLMRFLVLSVAVGVNGEGSRAGHVSVPTQTLGLALGLPPQMVGLSFP